MRPGPEQGFAACEAAAEEVPERGRVGAGSGTAVAERGAGGATAAGIGYAAARSGRGETVAAVAVANGFGDVIGAGGELLAAPRGEDGEMGSTADRIAAMEDRPTGRRSRSETRRWCA